MTIGIIPQMSDVSKSIETDLSDIDEAANIIDSMEVVTPADLNMAVQMTATIKESYAEIDGKRDGWVRPLKSVIDDINETFNPALNALDSAERKLKEKIETCTRANDSARMEYLSRVESAPEEARGALLILAEQHAVDKIPGLSIRKSYKGQIVDKSKIVAWAIKTGQYRVLDINEKELNIMTKEYGKAVDVPGWEIVEKNTVAITVAKVKK